MGRLQRGYQGSLRESDLTVTTPALKTGHVKTGHIPTGHGEPAPDREAGGSGGEGVGGMLIREIMSNKMVFLQPDDTFKDAIRLFQRTRLEGAPVVDGEMRVTGIFTRSHVFEGLLQERNLDEPVKSLMNTNVVTVSPEMTFADLANEVRGTQVGQAVVTTHEGRVVGMLTKVDVINALLDRTDFLSSELGSVVESMYNGAVAVNADGTVTILNPAAERILGLSGLGVIGQPVESVFPAFELGAVLSTGIPMIGRRLAIGNSVVVANSTPILQGDRVAGALAVFQDLTEYERVARELESTRKLHHTLDTVLELAYDGIVVVDSEGIVTMINRTLAEFLGVRRDDVIGKHCTEVLENSRLHIVAKMGVPEVGHIQMMRGNKYIVSRLPLVEDGRVVGAVGKVIFRGLGELKEIARRLETLENQLAYYKEELNRVSGARYTIESIVSSNVSMTRLKKEAQLAARGNATVLILGESGTGKELFAHAIHNASARRLHPFIKVNCAAIPENLLESEFFGYVEGAFTGARKGGKPGKFEMANGGTIFLDEIGDMAPALQAKLLRVLQEREIERVGGTGPIRVDVRIIAASNKDLGLMVQRGEFREDLYYRLNVICLSIPPLRERQEDVLPLAHHLIQKYNLEIGTRVKGISPEALTILQEYQWPGNVRELENVIERAMNLDIADMIRPEHFPPHLVGKSGLKPFRQAVAETSYREAVAEAEKKAILTALQKAGGNKTRAAKILGLSRSRFYEKLNQVGLGK